MKVKPTKSQEKITLIPENDLDVYNLGKISTAIGHETQFSIDTKSPNPKITQFRIKIDSLVFSYLEAIK